VLDGWRFLTRISWLLWLWGLGCWWGLGLAALAQPTEASRVAAYLEATEPLLEGLEELRQEYLEALPQLRRERDLWALRAHAMRQVAAWSGFYALLEQLTPPPECASYHNSLLQLAGLQSARGILAAELAQGALRVTAEAAVESTEGAAKLLAGYQAAARDLHARREALQEEVSALDQALREQQARLLPLLESPAPAEQSSSSAEEAGSAEGTTSDAAPGQER
jgi:hypothetical protein